MSSASLLRLDGSTIHTRANGGEQRDQHGFSLEDIDDETSAFLGAQLRHAAAASAAAWDALLGDTAHGASEARDARLAAVPRADLCALINACGIPHPLRPFLWRHLAGVAEYRATFPADHYERHVALSAEPAVMAESARTFEQIRKDLPRTFPGHPDFDNDDCLERLRRVLFAFSLHNPSIGYLQSMNFLCATILMIFDNQEEEAFWMLVTLLERVLPTDFYTQDMASLQRDQNVMETLVSLVLPQLSSHLQQLEVPFSLITCQWLLCLFVSTVPSESTYRIWDLVFAGGDVCLFRASLALLRTMYRPLIECTESSDAMELLKKGPRHVLNANYLLHISQCMRHVVTPALVLSLRNTHSHVVAAAIAETHARRLSYKNSK